MNEKTTITVNSHTPNSQWRDPTDVSILFMVLRHPFVLLVVLTACVGGAWFYLKNATPLYTSTARVRIQPGMPQVYGGPEQTFGPEETLSFINAEVGVLTSEPVVAAALKKVAGHDASGTEIDQAQKRLRAGVGRKDGIVTVEYDAPTAAGAAGFVNALVESYTATASKTKEATNQKLLTMLKAERETLDASIRDRNAKLAELVKQGGTIDGRDRAIELAASKASLRQARSDAAAAETMYRGALAALKGEADLLAQLDRLGADKMPAPTDLEHANVRLHLAELELRRDEMARSAGPSNPKIIDLQKQLDRYRVLYAGLSQARWFAAKARAEQLQPVVVEQEQAVALATERSARYARLDGEVRRLETQLDSLDERVKGATAQAGIGMTRIAVLENARPAAAPSKPNRMQTYAMGAAGGLFAGGTLAFCIEWLLMQLRAAKARRLMAALPQATSAVPEIEVYLPGGGGGGGGGTQQQRKLSREKAPERWVEELGVRTEPADVRG